MIFGKDKVLPSGARVRAMGIRDRPISPRSPWQNPYAERLIAERCGAIPSALLSRRDSSVLVYHCQTVAPEPFLT